METTATRTIKVAEFCRLYGVSMSKAYEEAREGRLLMKKLGKATVIVREDAENWLQSLPAKSAA
jgi:predicted DNA-binding transcriptional regulator AlpA